MMRLFAALLIGLTFVGSADAKARNSRDLSEFPKTEGRATRVEQASTEFDTFIVRRGVDTFSITFEHNYRNILLWSDTDFGYHTGSAPSGTTGVEVFTANGYFMHVATFKKGSTIHTRS